MASHAVAILSGFAGSPTSTGAGKRLSFIITSSGFLHGLFEQAKAAARLGDDQGMRSFSIRFSSRGVAHERDLNGSGLRTITIETIAGPPRCRRKWVDA